MTHLVQLRLLTAILLLSLACVLPSVAQEKDAKAGEKQPEAAPAVPPKEESSITDHTIKVGGQTIPCKAVAATILLKNEKEEPTALIYYTAYARSDVKDLSQRPISIVYNGGPGSSSVWLHMGSFSPPGSCPGPPCPFDQLSSRNPGAAVANQDPQLAYTARGA
jgi:carboxypeptidase C (cathepsin A)